MRILTLSRDGSEGNRVGRCVLDASGSGQGPVAGSVYTVMKFQVPLKAENVLTN